MTPLHGLIFFAATFALVFLMGLQSRNVNSGQYIPAGATSMLIGACQIFTVRGMALSDPLDAFLLTALAGPSAICLSMYVHRKVFRK